jgi:two-component system LytT family response regulator
VFVTAYDTHALRAFEFGALDYLLKPLDTERFHRALERAKGRIVEMGSSAAAQRGRFLVRSHGRIRFVAVADIDWVEAADYYAQLHVARESHLLRKSLSELERELEPAGFCRIHRSIVVNLERVIALELRADGEYDAVLQAGARLRVSRTFRKTVQERLGVLFTPCGRQLPSAID